MHRTAENVVDIIPFGFASGKSSAHKIDVANVVSKMLTPTSAFNPSCPRACMPMSNCPLANSRLELLGGRQRYANHLPIVMCKCPFAEATYLWLQRVIVQHNLCPWAGPTLQAGNVCFLTSPAASLDDAELLELIVSESEALIAEDELPMVTTIIAVPHASCTFTDFRKYCWRVGDDLKKSGLPVEIAIFHPDFEADEVDEISFSVKVNDGTFKSFDEHYRSHQSPYPLIHLLRECDLDSVDWTRAEKVRKDNFKTIVKLGADELERLRVQCIADSIRLTGTQAST
mmetsp:Transcript_101885/g.177061  ORF Transcript_101885/g.177061 Transcript_101885/m.177061 type:complete len:286 (-) Transcript_101885:30-887(-)